MPGTLKDIRLGAIVQFVVDLDKGDAGRVISLQEFDLRPNLMTENFKEAVAYEYSLSANKKDYEFKKKALQVTSREFTSLREMNDEIWDQLPNSVYGLMTLFLISSHEAYEELLIREREYEKEFLSTGDADIKRKMKSIFWERMKLASKWGFSFTKKLIFVVICFLIQFVLIYFTGQSYVGYPDPVDMYIFCNHNVVVQISVAVLVFLQFVASLVDVYTEARGYVSRTMSIYQPELSEYKTVRIDSTTRSTFSLMMVIITLACELTICILVFVYGLAFILAQEEVGDIVQGSVGIIFITDIDNMIYSIMPDGSIEDVYFRFEDFDLLNNVWESFPYSLSKEKMMKKGKSEDEKAKIRIAERQRAYMQDLFTIVGKAAVYIIMITAVIYVIIYKDNCPDYEPTATPTPASSL